MFKMSRRLSVCCPDRPSVSFLHHVLSTLVDHRLDGKHHPRHDLYTFAALAVVGYFGFFMELLSNSMSHQLSDNTVSKAFNILLNGKGYISDPVPGLCLRNGQVERFIGP